MSITKLDITDYKQRIISSKENKLIYGEINTPFSLIQDMFNLFPEKTFTNPDLKWLDPCCGCGYFTIVLFKKLFQGLVHKIPDESERKKHIIENMIWMVEINRENKKKLFNLFGENANIIISDFLDLKKNQIPNEFDIIINPPYNSNGNIKVPTNKSRTKVEDGKTIWRDFTKSAISLLKPSGLLCFIIPSIWLKPDKFHMYEYLTNYKITKLHCLTNTETNQIFCGEAQTPTCYFILENTINQNKNELKQINIYDKNMKKYTDYLLLPDNPVPVFGVSVIQKLIPWIQKVGCLQVVKTNEPSKKLDFSSERTEKYNYPCILSATLKSQEPFVLNLKTNYCSEEAPYTNQSKLILAHKMYGFPLLDWEGKWGISRRDSYVILNKSKSDLCKIQQFLSTYFALYVFESTRYRMKYLEKYAFQFLPDITKLPDFPVTINDSTIAEYFGFSLEEINAIQKLHKKKYFK